jgi:hypothetical protein
MSVPIRYGPTYLAPSLFFIFLISLSCLFLFFFFRSQLRMDLEIRGAIPYRRDRVGCLICHPWRQSGNQACVRLWSRRHHAYVLCTDNNGGGWSGVPSGRSSGAHSSTWRYPEWPGELRGSLETVGDGQNEAEGTNSLTSVPLIVVNCHVSLTRHPTCHNHG